MAAAKRALTAGFDFIELHMAHAYVLSSFLSRVNKRTDGYGGSLNNRMKLPVEVFQAVRGLVGENFPLGVRINGEDFHLSGNTLAQSSKIGVKFAELGETMSAFLPAAGSKTPFPRPKAARRTPCPATPGIV